MDVLGFERYWCRADEVLLSRILSAFSTIEGCVTKHPSLRLNSVLWLS